MCASFQRDEGCCSWSFPTDRRGSYWRPRYDWARDYSISHGVTLMWHGRLKARTPALEQQGLFHSLRMSPSAYPAPNQSPGDFPLPPAAITATPCHSRRPAACPQSLARPWASSVRFRRSRAAAPLWRRGHGQAAGLRRVRGLTLAAIGSPAGIW